jgi:group I intron endonuclease
MSQGIIYLIINKENGHKYIGQTTQALNKVWQQHIQESKRMSSKPLHKAFRKYGVDKFLIKVIDECNQNLLDEKENYWIQKYDTLNGYNGIEEEPIISPEPEKQIPIVKKKEIEPKPTNTDPWGFLTEENRSNGKHCGLSVLGINIETGEEKIWDNAREAALEVTGNRNKNSNILKSARNGYKCYGYRWRILDDKTKKKGVIGVHKKTWNRIYFESIAEARRQLGNGCKGAGLIKSLKHPHKYSWKGYYWYFT